MDAIVQTHAGVCSTQSKSQIARSGSISEWVANYEEEPVAERLFPQLDELGQHVIGSGNDL